jgi:NNP family nitrate/nitrite transporter-like MFS transporter
VYFTSFGGFVALTSWLPTYWTSAFAIGVVGAGLLTAMYSLTASGMRIVGGVLADSLYEGGQNAGILSLLVMLTGAMVMATALTFELAVPGVLLLAIGMWICNAAVFKIVPQVVPQAVGGAAGWVGGLGAFGGFAIPPMMAFAVRDLGQPGYSIGFIVFVFLALVSLALTWVVKYARAGAPTRETPLPARAT